ncbi:MAG: sugar phosphate isomerase/epimerase [Candidatus Coatesbacteria bacterium]
MSKIPIGVQLYSIREDCEKDLAGSLAKVAKIGYAGVEWAGYHGKTAKELRKLQDDHGLKACGTHIGLEQLMPDKINATMDFNQEIGNKYLIVPGLPKERYVGQAWMDTGKLFSELAAKVKPRGFRVGYHNHHIEFKSEGGKTLWDIFYETTSADVVLQMDTGNAYEGGGDVLAYLKCHLGRSVTVHLKPFSKTNKTAVIGEDETKWKEVFDACEHGGGTEWYIVEHESDPVSPMNAIQKCFEGLRELGKV